MGYGKDQIELLKSSIDIVDIIGRDIGLKAAGANYKGLCPFHGDRTPSLIVSPAKQIFTCFACGATGDAIEFTKRYHNLDFVEAIERLAKESGITLKDSGRSSKSDFSRLYDANKEAARHFYGNLSSAANPGYAYMKKRGITVNTLSKFGIGYATDDWQGLHNALKSKGFKDKELLQIGLISESKGRTFDKFRARVIFPIINTRGRVIGFGGRILGSGKGAKYLNSPESPIFSKKDNLYGINTAKAAITEEGYVIVVEGYMDVISLYQSGVKNVVASLGTALTQGHGKLLKKFTRDVVLTYDSDDAGRKAALRGIDILTEEGFSVKVLHVDDGKDPDEYIKKHGKDEFLHLIKNAKPAVEYKLEVAGKDLDLGKDQDKVVYLKRAVEILKNLSPVEAGIYASRLSQRLGISIVHIEEELGRGTKSQRVIRETLSPERREITENLSIKDKTLLALLLESEDAVDVAGRSDDLLSKEILREVWQVSSQLMEEKGKLDRDEIRERLGEDRFSFLNTLLRGIIVTEDSLDGVIREHKFERLKKKELELIDKISLAEGSDLEGQAHIIDELTLELMDIQKKIKHFN